MVRKWCLIINNKKNGIYTRTNILPAHRQPDNFMMFIRDFILSMISAIVGKAQYQPINQIAKLRRASASYGTSPSKFTCQGTSSRRPRVFQTNARNPAARQHHWYWLWGTETANNSSAERQPGSCPILLLARKRLLFVLNLPSLLWVLGCTAHKTMLKPVNNRNMHIYVYLLQ